ncbi:MAG: hypothetical protein OS130_15615 [Thermodesulfobacteriota bacterium]|jgi:hypothetical protein|nr:MAG: hypothetical protein OS130_15615 [Thermodesulfobacteriota bacterium]
MKMMKIKIMVVVGVLLVCFSAFADVATAKVLLARVKDFYMWVLANHAKVSALEPRIRNVEGSTRFYLDMKTLDEFSREFMKSGLFSKQFPEAIARYYKKYEAQFNALPQSEFDELAKDGRGPMMEVEDMDIFFCAQEYEYDPEFIQGMRISELSEKAGVTSVVVESSYKWKTTFDFKQEDGRWLIVGYCVYQ